jgi:hypothetical protein
MPCILVSLSSDRQPHHVAVLCLFPATNSDGKPRQATASHLTSVIAENKSKPTSLSPVIKAQKESRQRMATTDNNPGNSRSRFRFPTCMHAPPTVKKIPSCCIWENLPSRTCIDQPTLTRGLRFFSGREDCVALCALVRLFQIVHDLRKTECGSPR